VTNLLNGKLGGLLSLCALKIIAVSQSLRLKQPRLAILTYHQIVSHAGPYVPGEFTVATFEQHIRVLKKNFNILSLSSAIELMQNDKLPPLALAITFDDGYRNNFTEAIPVLYKNNIPAAIFVVSHILQGNVLWSQVVNECIRRTELETLDLSDIDVGCYTLNGASQKLFAITDIKDKLKYADQHKRLSAVSEIHRRCNVNLQNIMMSAEDLSKLKQYNIEVGAHTVTHPVLNLVSDDMASHEIRDCKSDIERQLRYTVKFFAYPNGKPDKDFSARHVDMVVDAGYVAAFSTQYGAADRRQNKFALPRISVWGENTAQFIMHIIRSY